MQEKMVILEDQTVVFELPYGTLELRHAGDCLLVYHVTTDEYKPFDLRASLAFFPNAANQGAIVLVPNIRVKKE